MKTSFQEIFKSFNNLLREDESRLTQLQLTAHKNRIQELEASFITKELSAIIYLLDATESTIKGVFRVKSDSQPGGISESDSGWFAADFSFNLTYENAIRQEIFKLFKGDAIKINGQISGIFIRKHENRHPGGEHYGYYPEFIIEMQLDSFEKCYKYKYSHSDLRLTLEEFEKKVNDSEIEIESKKIAYKKWKEGQEDREFNKRTIIIFIFILTIALGLFFYNTFALTISSVLFLYLIVSGYHIGFLYDSKIYNSKFLMALLGYCVGCFLRWIFR